MIFCVSPVEKSHIDQLDGSESLSSSERLPIFYREYVLGIWVPQTLLLSLPPNHWIVLNIGKHTESDCDSQKSDICSHSPTNLHLNKIYTPPPCPAWFGGPVHVTFPRCTSPSSSSSPAQRAQRLRQALAHWNGDTIQHHIYIYKYI